MRNSFDLIADLREETHPLANEAADAIETLSAELHRAEYIIQEQARENRLLRNKLKEARGEN